MHEDYAAQFLVGASSAAASAVFNLAMTGQVNWLWVLLAFTAPFLVLRFYQRSGFLPFKKWCVRDNELIARTGQATGYGAWELDTSERSHWAIHGPHKPLARGKYRATFRLKINSTIGDEAVADLDVAARHGAKILALRTLTIQDFRRADTYQDFPLDFYLLHDDNEIEFRISTQGAQRRLVLDHVALSRRL
ncbi:MAG: hypothetical protein A2W37_03685 [Chloroflexi bacterium RBG_16_63_12]|jgi:hypothetical protein|nr:hypothetical protein [Anaerolineales bacterium]OGO45967.1 MAG: hypothetical protein A2W37_03685 [Chloroflexi bacterium RBG_16_63_12]